MADLQADIVQHNLEWRELVDELAAKHKFKAKLVKQCLTSWIVFKKSRKPSLFRAKLHYLSKVLNEGLSKNERLSLHDIRKRALDYPEFENMSREFKEELLKDFEENRLTKKTGTQASNKAVAQDTSHVIKKMDEEIRKLFERCRMYGITIFSKGHIQDKTIPYILESASASDFIRECLKIDQLDLVVRFEQWCCSRELGLRIHRGGHAPEHAKRNNDEDVDEPPANKSKDSDGRPKPKPKWKGALTTSDPKLRTSTTVDNPSSAPSESSGASSVGGGSGGAAAASNAGSNIPKVRATVKGKAGRGPPGIRNPNPTLMS
ncbi:hypothetical protein C8R45DRAFT_1097421 [Mycena sanguinolenta]|nr:hypothetical protein C8R45DRAFT_1097421 [Mycena sanguinolenta]